MSAYMPIFEAIAWVGSGGPDLYCEVNAERHAEIGAGFKAEGNIVGWLALDQKLMTMIGCDYDSVAADIFALAEVGQVPSIGRHPGSNTYVDIPKLAYVGAKLAGGIDGFRLKDSAIIDIFDENWCDVQFLRTAIERQWPGKPAAPVAIPRFRDESDGVNQLRSFLKYASENGLFVIGGPRYHTGPQLRDAYNRWCRRGNLKIKPLDRSTYYTTLRAYRAGRWT